MRVDRPELRKTFIAALTCTWCGKPSPQGCDPCHLLTRGAGQIDIRCNLFAAHRFCHTETEGQPEARAKLAILIAKRERTTPEAIVEAVYFWRRQPKGSTAEQIRSAVVRDSLSAAAIRLIRKDIEELIEEGIILLETFPVEVTGG